MHILIYIMHINVYAYITLFSNSEKFRSHHHNRCTYLVNPTCMQTTSHRHHHLCPVHTTSSYLLALIPYAGSLCRCLLHPAKTLSAVLAFLHPFFVLVGHICQNRSHWLTGVLFCLMMSLPITFL